MADSFGLSFAPLQQQPGYGGDSSQGQPQNSIQQAIQILSLRRPTVWGSAAPAPAALISGQGGSASVTPNTLQMLLRHLQGQFGEPTQAPWQGPAAGDLSDLFGMGQRQPTTMGAGGMVAPAFRGPSIPDAAPPTFPTIPNPQIVYNQTPDYRTLPDESANGQNDLPSIVTEPSPFVRPAPTRRNREA